MNIELPKEDYEFLKELQHELNTLDTDRQAEPIYYYELERLLKILKTMEFSD